MDGYSRSQFSKAILVYLQLFRLGMHIEPQAGEKMDFDCACKKLVPTGNNNIRQEVAVFVAILGCSQFTDVEL